MITQLLFDIGSIISLAWSYLTATFFSLSYALQAIFTSTGFATEIISYVHPIIGGSIICTILIFGLKFLIGR